MNNKGLQAETKADSSTNADTTSVSQPCTKPVVSCRLKFRAWVTNMSIPFITYQETPDLETLQSFMFHYGNEKFLMQYTGLNDKNGKEIFEGDFCKNEQGEHGLIMYSEGSYWLSYFEEPAKQHLSDFKKYNEENTTLLITGIRSFANGS